MHNPLRAGTLAASLLLGAAIVIPATSPAIAQDRYSISFSVFHDRLGQYGDWVYSDRWGEVWIPADVPEDFHPYDTDGHWVYTDYYGWMWVSDYPWGDITFHYGRWVDDPDAGWMWIPGYVWSPAWVVWRSNGRYVGWMPMPPDEQFLRGVSFGISTGPLSFGINFGDTGGYYGYSRWYSNYDQDMFDNNWVFVRKGYIADRNFRRYAAPRHNYRMLLNSTRDVTHYSVQNNYIVNRSIAVSDVEHASGHRVPRVQARMAIKNPQFITNVNVGLDVQKRARNERPHGNGEQGSAPKPPQNVIQSLSPDLRNTHVRNKQNFYTKQNAAQGNFGKGGENNAGPNNNNNNSPPNMPGGENRHGRHEGNGPNNSPATNNPPGTNTLAPQGPAPGTAQPGSETHHGRHEQNGPNNQNNNQMNPTGPNESTMPGKSGTGKPGEQHISPPVAPPPTLSPPSENPNAQGAPNGGTTGTPETPRNHHERGHNPPPGSETNQPNNAGNPGQPPPEGDHMNHDNSHTVHDRNPPTMPSEQPTVQPDHGNQLNTAPPEKGKHENNGNSGNSGQSDKGQSDNGKNDKHHKHDENNPPPQ